MGEAYSPAEGRALITEAWYDALDNLIEAMQSEEPRHRLEAARTVLEYVTKLNVGLGEPFIPDVRPPQCRPIDGEDDE